VAHLDHEARDSEAHNFRVDVDLTRKRHACWSVALNENLMFNPVERRRAGAAHRMPEHRLPEVVDPPYRGVNVFTSSSGMSASQVRKNKTQYYRRRT
jgi:hypothetical protein